MFQNGEFWKITLEMIMFLEFMNSMRLGLVNWRVCCLHMFHQTLPWPSIVPFSPMKITNWETKKRMTEDYKMSFSDVVLGMRFLHYCMSKNAQTCASLPYSSKMATYFNFWKNSIYPCNLTPDLQSPNLKSEAPLNY